MSVTNGTTVSPGHRPVFSIDVECVAVGQDHNARAVAQISLVDQYEKAVLNLYVLPQVPVVSYLTPLTGLTAELLARNGIPFPTAMQILRQHLPRHAILVGQNIFKDAEWLGLKDGEDFAQLMDLTGLFRIWNEKYKSFSVFSQDHLAKVLLAWDVSGSHDAVGDAIKSIRLFNLYQSTHGHPERWAEVCAMVLGAEPEPSFAKRNPTFEGVCMGNRKNCSCGAPFFG
jgi:DNA polymerase III epsilon subunit-like protein